MLYLMVLGSAILLSVIGISAVLAARVDLQNSADAADCAQAVCCARSAVDYVGQMAADDNSWIAAQGSVWRGPVQLGRGRFEWRFIDATGTLPEYGARPLARLYVRGTCGRARRLFSVLAVLPGDYDCVLNGGFESGTADWVADGCTLTPDLLLPHGGLKDVSVGGRASASSGAVQPLGTRLENGHTYRIEFWATVLLLTANVQSELEITSTEGTVTFTGAPTTVLLLWGSCTADFTPAWTGELLSSSVRIRTSSGSGDFKLDDVSVIDRGPHYLEPIPGTWRHEVLP
jgi:hypothetical protein